MRRPGPRADRRRDDGPAAGGTPAGRTGATATAIGPEAREVGRTRAARPAGGIRRINIAYGTEKQQWLEEAAAEFQKSEAGRGITIALHGMGSMEGARAVLDGPEPIPMHVWSPASSAYRDIFEQEWRAKHGKSPILKAENLVLTPMVFVMWKSRHEAFIKKYSEVTLPTMAEAMQEPGGWGTIANHPDWGRFKFGHTHPEQSNSGLLTLVLMAYEFFGKEYNLSRDESPARVPGLAAPLRAGGRPAGRLADAQHRAPDEGDGPPRAVAIRLPDRLREPGHRLPRRRARPMGAARGRLPRANIWNEHPYYILDVPWSDARQRAAAGDSSSSS